MKTKESRFQVHDELTAPELSLPVLKGAVAGGGQLEPAGCAGGLAGHVAGVRTLPLELRHGELSWATSSGSGWRWPSMRAATTASGASAHRPRCRPRARRDRARAGVRVPRRARDRAAPLPEGAAREHGSSEAAPPRGGPRGGLGRRGDPRGRGARRARDLHESRHPGGGPPAGRLGRERSSGTSRLTL